MGHPRRLRRDLLLYAPALGIAVLGLVESLLADLGSGMHGPAWANAAFSMACAVPLLWRRAHPLAAFAVVWIVALVWADALYLHRQHAPIEAFLAAVVALFAAAHRVDAGQAPVILLLIGIAILGMDLPALVLGRDAGYVVPAYLFLGATWVAGRALRGRQAEAQEQSTRAALAEADRDRRVADERARIARELHDVIAHSVSVMVVQAAAERRALAGERPQTAEALELIERCGREALAELRRLLGVLRRPEAGDLLAPQPGLARLDGLIEQARAAGLAVDLTVEGQARPLPPGVDLSAYRIVQEALTNVRKHADGAPARVLVRFEPRVLVLDVSDDGRRSPRLSDGGHGLIGMRERAALYGGSLHAGPRPDGGFRVHARLPVDGA